MVSGDRIFDHLYAEWEVKDANHRCRYIDFAYFPGGQAKGALESMGYGPHARDLTVGQFKDQCARHALLALDDWVFLPVAYPALIEDPTFCQQLMLAFVGKFQSMELLQPLHWAEAETVRFARRCLRPFDAHELARHLQVSAKYARAILRKLVSRNQLIVAGGNQRYRTFMFPVEGSIL